MIAKQKVLLINPPGKCFINSKTGSIVERKHCQLPLGISYIAAASENSGYEVEILDILAEGYENERVDPLSHFLVYGLSIEDTVQRVVQSKPDIIGISVLFSHLASEVFKYVEAIKAQLPDTPIVMGGHHASAMPKQVLESHDGIDFVLIGECDETFPKFLDQYFDPEKDNSFSEVNGLYYRDSENKSKIFSGSNQATPAVSGSTWNYFSRKESANPDNIKTLNRPAWHLFDLNKYWDSSVRMGGGDVMGKRYAVMVSTRGCPHVCYFCTSPLMGGYKGYRKRDNDDVIDEIQWLVDTYDVDEIQFLDDNFFISKKRVIDLLNRVAEKFPNLTFSVPAGTEVNALDEEVIQCMERANFYRVTLAIEAGDQDIQDAKIDKQVDLSRVPWVIQKCKESGLEVRGFFMMGFPGETREQIYKTAEFAFSLDLDDIALSVVAPLPGTPLFDECLENDLFVEDFNVEDIRYSVSQIKMADIDGDELEEIRRSYWEKNIDRRLNSKSKKGEPLISFNSAEEYSHAGFTTEVSDLRNIAGGK